MADTEPGAGASPEADEAAVDRGQRVFRETRFETGADGKHVARFVRPVRGMLPADVHGAPGETGAPATVEDVVEPADTASAWEAVPEAPDRG